jgi:hypothetical protein
MSRPRSGGMALCVLFTAVSVWTDVVVPSADVTTRVIVRASASSQSAQIGSLRPAEQLELTGSVPNWYEVPLPNGATGFVSKRWTRVIAIGAPPIPTTASTFTITGELRQEEPRTHGAMRRPRHDSSV